jgi:hypothetical protein
VPSAEVSESNRYARARAIAGATAQPRRVRMSAWRQLVGLVEDGDVAGQEPAGDKAAWSAWFEAMDALWATQAAPSPGGWSAPGEPPQGLVDRLDRVPWWVRVWYHFGVAMASTGAQAPLDRASAWMWSHGGFDVIPRSVRLPAPPEPPPASAPSVVLPLTGEGVYLGDLRREDPEPGLVHACGARWPVGGRARIIDHGRWFFNQRWASRVFGVRPTDAKVSVRFCRSSRWRLLRRSREAEVVYGPQGLWAAETLGHWDVVEVSHAEQTHRTDFSPARGWSGRRRWSLRRRRPRAGESGTTFGP